MTERIPQKILQTGTTLLCVLSSKVYPIVSTGFIKRRKRSRLFTIRKKKKKKIPEENPFSLNMSIWSKYDDLYLFRRSDLQKKEIILPMVEVKFWGKLLYTWFLKNLKPISGYFILFLCWINSVVSSVFRLLLSIGSCDQMTLVYLRSY